MPLSSKIRPFNRVGLAEATIAERVVWNDPLSGYLASHPRGGQHVQRLEDAWAERFGVRHAIACNSATTGLLAAATICSPPWDHEDVAVPSFTMSATAAAAHIASPTNALFFMDCDNETYCSTPLHCPRTHIGLIVVTNLFGQAAPLEKWRELADELEVAMIEDAAQAPLAETPDGAKAGTVGDVGVFSLNVHKHLQTGEGGVMVTNNDGLAEELRGFVNHGECMGHARLGLNLRMTEVTAAIALNQLKKADEIISSRIELAHELSDMVKDFWIPPVEYGKHVYYHWAVRVPNRDAVCNYLRLEGIPVRNGYVKPLYNIPAFQAWEIVCPNAERAHKELMIFETCAWDPTKEQRREMREIFKRAGELSNMEECRVT